MDEFQIRYGDVHFTEEGYRYLAKAVASCILKHLENKAWNV
jgi:lysophospholipase L1-like esterase